MEITVTVAQLTHLGLTQETAEELYKKIKPLFSVSPEQAWASLSKTELVNKYSFSVHLFLFSLFFPRWRQHPESAPAWIPTFTFITTTNLYQFITELNFKDISHLHRWSIHHYADFWQAVIKKLHIVFKKAPQKIGDVSRGIESVQWLPKAALNIIDSCFNAPPSYIALVFQDTQKNIKKMTYAELNYLSNRVANSLVTLGYVPGNAIGIAMPMNEYAVAIYLGIIKMGGIVVSIADSFSSQEIATRLDIANAKTIFTQDFTIWNGKQLSLYEKIIQADPAHVIVVPATIEHPALALRDQDYCWTTFLSDNEHFTSVACEPMQPCNILFSSGTTAAPKAIIWNHTTPIKVASDAYFHQNIQLGDILAWPTNLGWMMGPWLIFASLINQATIALYTDAPTNRSFGEFVQNTNVTMLGVVPTLVATWRQSQCMENLNWHSIDVFSSTGECSNAEDMLYLMSLAGYQPVIEYCGGTEVGGAYVTSTLIQNNYPGLFSTPAMGLDFLILDEKGKPANLGEVAIIPPSIGLSTELLNANHHQIYFDNMPKTADGKILRRHGDEIKRLSNGYYMILGRSDDSMNLGGIKISAAEIERAIAGLPHVVETAAIATTQIGNGPSQLVIYAATHAVLDKKEILSAMQKRIHAKLNPLFKIHDIVFVSELPKTASNKIMRRTLRKMYQDMKKSS